jgi:uncharacterized protein
MAVYSIPTPMKKTIYAVIYLFLITSAQAADTDNSAYQNKYCGQTLVNKHGPLFRVEKKGRSAILLGTLDRLTVDAAELAEKIYLPLLKKSDILVTESGLPDYTEPVLVTLEKQLLPKISSLIDEEMIQEIARAIGDPTFATNDVFTALDTLTKFVNTRMSARQQKFNQSLKFVLIKNAELSRMPTTRVETIESIQEFKSIPPNELTAYIRKLHEMAIKSDDPNVDSQALANSWYFGDIDQFEKLSHQKINEGLSTNGLTSLFGSNHMRSTRFANKIDLFFDETHTNKYFIALGAEHLGGEHGLLRILEARGYRVNCQ